MRISLLLALLLNADANADGQREPAPQRVRLTAAAEAGGETARGLRPRGRLIGVLVAEDEESLTVRPEGRREQVRIPRASLAGLEVSRGRKSRLKGALIGLGVGFGLGLATHLSCDDGRSWVEVCDTVALAVTVGAGGVGALLGLAASPGERWERQPVRPEGPGAHFKLTPGRRGVGAALSIGF